MKFKYLVILLVVVGCDNPCQWIFNNRVNQQLRAELFDKCLARVAEARKGVNYTAHDDEDYDEVVEACSNSAWVMSQYCIIEEVKE